ncbi:SGNH/GDSL hydrolase family protein [Burkholderia vietnamiensis]|uniref:SGNH/GDSL hydrolase family protein n=1 Tax=Burkholderia vietnamiensis TaxID=60552 RepID=UPI001CF18258|nr:SGNH/GDSL hydrolase family protein [Burkholderia vietnamiensis]MCA8195498.1 SGNH/GDSL hydrolase family protein [Burkholderia vietnamiensis]
MDHKMLSFNCMKILKTLLIPAIVAISGCGGGDGSSPAAPKSISIDVEGDSTIYGLQATGRSANPPPAVLQTELQNSFGPTVTTINSGISSATVHESLYGIAPHYSQPLSTRLASMSSQIVIMNYGLNDSANSTLSDYIADLNTWIDVVNASGKIPVLEEPNPSCNPAMAELPKFVVAMDQVAQQRGVQIIQQYAYIQSLPNWQSMLPDCLHPDDALYKIKADREYAVIAPIVKSLMQ